MTLFTPREFTPAKYLLKARSCFQGEVGKHKVRNFRENINLSNCLSFKKVETGHIPCALSAEILYPARYKLICGGESSVNRSF